MSNEIMGKGNIPISVSGVDATGQDKELVPKGEKVKTLKFPHGFNAYVIEAIKELKTENDILKSENDAMKMRLAALEKMLGTEKMIRTQMDADETRIKGVEIKKSAFYQRESAAEEKDFSGENGHWSLVIGKFVINFLICVICVIVRQSSHDEVCGYSF